MPRQPRFFLPEVPLHIVQRGNNRQPTFVDGADRRAYLRLLRQGASEHGVAIHAYVLMTNHVHLLATPADVAGVPRLMHVLGTRYVQRFNRRFERTGSLWEGRYRATIVETDRYFLACMRYIELNPVRAGLCAKPGDHLWSSYRFNTGSRETSWLTQHQVYRTLGDSAAACTHAYRALFEDQLPPEMLHAIRDATRHEWALGGSEFCSEIEARTRRRAVRRSTGRKPIEGRR